MQNNGTNRTYHVVVLQSNIELIALFPITDTGSYRTYHVVVLHLLLN